MADVAVRTGAALLACFVAACAGTPSDSSGAHTISREARDTALARAHVWRSPAVAIERADLSRNPAGPFRDTDDVTCTFIEKTEGGTTPKFHCRTPDGLSLKVKYGPDNPELPAEAAASRLLHALGFPVDHVFRVHSVTCLGCPADPFSAMQCVERGGSRDSCLKNTKRDRVVFGLPTIERPIEGTELESAPDQGWSWYELDAVSAHTGGSPRAEVDALRLMAVLLAHWDNKGPNQRLICPPGTRTRDGVCSSPLAMIHDLGATFGPLKLDLPNWRHSAIWADPRSCIATMKSLPYDGGTFTDHAISEEGRQFVLALLQRLSEPQIRGLFEGSGATRLNHVAAAARDPGEWTRTFFDKVGAIASAGPCPSAASLAARGQ
jgi:hypothetical protein